MLELILDKLLDETELLDGTDLELKLDKLEEVESVLELLLMDETELNELKELNEEEDEDAEDKLDVEDDDTEDDDTEDDDELLVVSAWSAKKFSVSGEFSTNCSASKTLLVNESISSINVMFCSCIMPLT